ncbi:MAG: metal-dependent hydrolase [Nanoarchaeota archaeon]
MFKTHLAFGFLIAMFALQYLHPSNQILFLALVLFSSIFPDIDHPKSKLGKYVPFNSILLEHRGFFHSFLILPLISLLLVLFSKTGYAIPVIIGYGSHLFSDAVTKEGIMPLHPLSKYKIKGFIETGKSLEYVLFLAITSISIWKLFNF